MASENFDASVVPRDIVAALGLTVGTAYTGQNLSTVATLLFREAAAMPDATARAFRVEAGGAFTLEPQSGVGIWLWSDDPLGCPILVSELA